VLEEENADVPGILRKVISERHGVGYKVPYFFPKGVRFFWKCEAEIPIPSIREVKAILN
jgi:hypothetical protein